MGDRLGRNPVVKALDDILAWSWHDPFPYALLVVAALIAGVWGFTSFYGPQFARTPVWSWPFVPDSPLATTMWLLASIWLKRRWHKLGGIGPVLCWLTCLAIVWNARTGVWTVFVLLYHYDHFFAGSTAQIMLEWLLVGTHLGMVGYALQLFRKVPAPKPLGWALLVGIVLAFDFVDYHLVPTFLPDSGYALYPNGVPGDPDTLRVVAMSAYSLSVVSLASLAIGLALRGDPVPDPTPRDERPA